MRLTNSTSGTLRLLLVLSVALACGTRAFADQAAKTPRTWRTVYVGFSLAWQSIGGDFDGQSFYAIGPSVVVVPEVSSGQGLGGFFGIRSDVIGVEIGYVQTAHSGQWAQIATDETYHRINLGIPFYLKSRQRFQPLINTGLYAHWLTVESGAFEFAQDLTTIVEEGDAEFLGLGGTIGVGFAYYFKPRLGLRLQLGYDMSFYSSISGVGTFESALLSASGLDNLSGNGWSSSVSFMLGL